MKHYNVVCALIFNEDNKVFCTKRGPGRALEGKWEFPGGKALKHEKYEDTIVREIKEELEATIKPLEYIGESYYEYHELAPYSEFSITLYAYKCKLVEGTLTLTEHTAFKWATIDEMKSMDFAAADKPLINMVKF